MGNLDTYKGFEQPPEWAMKPIKGGRMSGKTDINPQWRIEALTEKYGPCGIGWTYTIERQWTQECGQEIGAFVNITLKYKTNAQNGWSEPIPGTGGNMLYVQEKNGLHFNDDAFKMALTDALSVACKSLGVGANVYKGMCDSKYGNQGDRQNQQSDKTWMTENDLNKVLALTNPDRVRDGLAHWSKREYGMKKVYRQRIEEHALNLESTQNGSF